MAKYSFSEHQFQFKDSNDPELKHLVLLDMNDPETLNRTLRLCRYKTAPDNIYDIQYNNNIELRSLRYMNEFDVFILSLERSGVKIILDEKECSDEVYSETKPEPTFEWYLE